MIEYLHIDGWKSGLKFSSCHIIPEHKKCSRLHGHTWVLNIRIHGEKNKKTGMIVDFFEIKSIAKEIINNLDHKLILGKNETGMVIRKKDIKIKEREKMYIFPKDDVVLLPINVATCENIAEYICEEISKKIEKFNYKNIYEVCVGVDEGWGQAAWARKKIINDA